MSNIKKISIPLFNFKELLYVVSLGICFQSSLFGVGEVNYFVRYIITFLWLVYFFYLLIRKRITSKFLRYKIFYLFLLPIIVVSLYTLLLYIFKVTDISYLGRTISCLIAYISPFLMSIIGFVLFQKKFFKLSLYGIVFAFFIVILFTLINCGLFKSLYNWAYASFIDSRAVKNPFEVHDLTFASGIVFLYYLLFEVKTKKNNYILMISVIIILLGFKRIQIIALFLILLYTLFNKFLQKRLSVKVYKKYIYGCSILFISLMFLFVYLIDSGYLSYICELLNINTMDRIDFYNWLADYFDFSMLYMGKGFGVVSRFMQTHNSYGIYFGTSSIHSEILRLFFELGFLGFLCLVSYYLVLLPKSISKLSNFRVAYIYLILQYYLFILHFTDNTFTYYTTQFIFCSVVLYAYQKYKLKKQEVVEIEEDSNYNISRE